MGQRSIETIKLQVPKDEGFILGDLLRKFATKSVGTWQVIGYKVASQSPNFGFSNGTLVSYLDLFDGRLVCNSDFKELPENGPKLRIFRWNGKIYSSDGLELHGLNNSFGESLEVCINWARGHYTAQQNVEVLKRVVGDNIQGYYAVPSAHSIVTTFKYSVAPLDDEIENLTIEADTGVVKMAVSNAVRSLKGLGI